MATVNLTNVFNSIGGTITSQTFNTDTKIAYISVSGNFGSDNAIANYVAYYTNINNVKEVSPAQISGNSAIFRFLLNNENVRVDLETASAYINVTNNITANKTIRIGRYDNGLNVVFSLRATNSGGEGWSVTPKLQYTDSGGDSQTVDFSVYYGGTDDYYCFANVVLVDIDTSKSVTITGTYGALPTITIVNNISDTTETHSYIGNVLSVSVVGTGANKRFTAAPTFSYTDTNNQSKTATFTVSVSGNTSTATITINDFNTAYSGTINGVFATVVDVTKNLSNCTLSGIGDYITAADLQTPFQLTATALQGCEFETAPQLSFTTNGLTPIVFTFTIAQNKLTASLTADLSSYYNDFAYIQSFTINAAAETVTPYTDVYGTINVYKVTSANLESFSAQRFFTENIAPPQGNETYQMIDLANYVCSLKRLYIGIGDTAPNVLKCGNYDTNISVVSPLADTITIDCGTVEIPKPNDNITDYNSEIQIFLPFIGLNSIPTDYVGKTIGLEYVANIVTANAVAKLTCDSIVFAYYECDISTDLVYKTLASLNELKNVGTLDFNMHVLKGLQPYIIVKYYTSANEKILNADCKRCVLNTITGKFTAIEITDFVSDKITNVEFEQLQRLLENGVIIEPVTEPVTPQTEP